MRGKTCWRFVLSQVRSFTSLGTGTWGTQRWWLKVLPFRKKDDWTKGVRMGVNWGMLRFVLSQVRSFASLGTGTWGTQRWWLEVLPFRKKDDWTTGLRMRGIRRPQLFFPLYRNGSGS